MPFPWIFKRKKSDDRGSLDRRSVQTWADSVEFSSRASQNRGRSSGGRSTEGRSARVRRASVHRDQEATDTDDLDGESVLSREERSTQSSTKTRKRRRRRSEETPRASHHNGHEFFRSAAHCRIENQHITINNGIGNEENRRNERRQSHSSGPGGSPSSQSQSHQSQLPNMYPPFVGGFPAFTYSSPYARIPYDPSMEARIEAGRTAFEDYQKNYIEPIQQAFYKQLHAEVPKRLAAAGIAPGTYPLPGMGY